MTSIWTQLQMAGWIGFLIVPVALLALLLGAVALLGGLIANKSRAFTTLFPVRSHRSRAQVH